MKRKLILVVLVSILTISIMGCGGSTPTTPTISTLIDYPMKAPGGNNSQNYAFFITSYPGTTLSKVTLYFSAQHAEAYTMKLRACDSDFTGTLIGEATASFTSITGNDNDFLTTVFDFGNLAVTKSHLVTFVMSKVSGTGYVFFFDGGDTGGAATIVKETSGAHLSNEMNSPAGKPIAIKVEGQN